MSFGFFLNMEKVSLEIIEEHIVGMTDINTEKDFEMFIDIDLFKDNLKKGYIITTMLIAYIESTLNSIMRELLGEQVENLLKCGIDDKLEIIYSFSKLSMKELKSNNYYACYKNIVKIRNELIHYKSNFLNEGMGVIASKEGNHIISKKELYEVFTKRQMEKYYKNIKEFINKIVKDLNLKINYKVKIFECDGRDGNCSYIKKKKTFLEGKM